MRKLTILTVVTMALGLPVFAQNECKTAVLKHLKISRDFTLKIADQMPESDYSFKLTPPQMSFAEQMVHLAGGADYILSPMTGQKPNPSKPASMNKADVIAFVKASFDSTIETVSKLTSEQLAKTYKSEAGTLTGCELLMFMLDHTTHHRASAEMYLRAKGITPAEYEF